MPGLRVLFTSTSSRAWNLSQLVSLVMFSLSVSDCSLSLAHSHEVEESSDSDSLLLATSIPSVLRKARSLTAAIYITSFLISQAFCKAPSTSFLSAP